MTTDQTDHRAAAAQFYGHSDEVLDDRAKPMGASSAMQRAQYHLLAALHDRQAEQTELLVAILDQMRTDALPTKAERACHATSDESTHDWFTQDEWTVERCRDCGTWRRLPEPDTVTVTLPRDAVEVTSTVGWRANADMLRRQNFRGSADLLNALADALDAANGSQS